MSTVSRRRPARRALRPRARRADLPHLGADLRLQPRVRPLPVQLRPARPARAEHRRGQGRHRRARADAGVLREHRRRRAHDPPRLLGAGRLRHRPPRRREVLHQRRRASPPEVAARLAPPATTSTCRSPSTAPPPRSTTPCGARARTTPPSPPWSTWPPPGFRGFKLSVVCTRAQHRPARRVQGHRRPLRRPAAPHPAAPVGPRRRRLGRAAPHRRPSSASSTTGCWPTATTSSPATRSSTSPATARRLPGPQPLRRRPGRVPDRPGRRRLRLPVRHPRRLPRRQRARRRRLRPRVARVGAVPLAARAAVGRRLRAVLGLRRLPRRLHGRQVLHRPAARRPRPRVREGPRRAAARRRGARAARPGPSADHSKPGRRCRSAVPAAADPTGPATRTPSPALAH